MQFEGNYILRGGVAVDNLVRALCELSEADWLEDSYRQETFQTHRDTNTIPLLFDDDFRHENPTRCKNYLRFAHVIEPIFAELARFFDDDGLIIRSLLVRLRPSGVIPPHIDRGFSLSNSHRLHIPVVTNDGVGFTVGGEDRHMRVGEVLEINNQRKHAAWNHGAENRVHLICDWAEADSIQSREA